MEQRTPSGVVPVSPGRGQESVWSYPRPPRIESVPERIRVIVDGRVLADTTRDQRVLETTHPPVFHLPPDDVDLARLHPADRTTVWEWKGVASHLDDADRGRRIDEVAWTGRDPEPRFEVIRDPPPSTPVGSTRAGSGPTAPVLSPAGSTRAGSRLGSPDRSRKTPEPPVGDQRRPRAGAGRCNDRATAGGCGGDLATGPSPHPRPGAEAACGAAPGGTTHSRDEPGR